MRVLLGRWAYFVLGGALFTPYALFVLLAVPVVEPADWPSRHATPHAIGLGLLLVALVLATSLVPVVRAIEGHLVPPLLGGPAADLAVMPARTPGSRIRGGLWFFGHTVGGAAVSLATVLGVPVAVVLLSRVWTADGEITMRLLEMSVSRGWAVPVALGILVGLVVVVVLAGRASAWLAPVLLGPDPIARVEELERRTHELAQRNRLAQELHDSLGHALTVTALQAGAARRVLDTDPAFVAAALDAIARTSRHAAGELDDVLGLLRAESAGARSRPTLAELDTLLSGHRAAGLPVTAEIEGDLADLPSTVSREVYRIVQEGLTNVARHAGNVPTDLRVAAAGGQLCAVIRNAAPAARTRRPAGGGRGLVGISERVELLGGRVDAGRVGAEWRLEVHIPVRAS